MHTLVYAHGRRLIQSILGDWPAPRCDATEGARLYLAHSCIHCGSIVWPDDERAPLHLNQTVCDNCRLVHGLTFVQSDLLISTLQELLFAWPSEVRSRTIDQTIAYLEAHAFSEL